MKEQSHRAVMDLDIVEQASEKDRQFFLDHPGAKHYYRNFIPGEAPLTRIARTKVTQVYPGFRTRQFFYKTGGRV